MSVSSHGGQLSVSSHGGQLSPVWRRPAECFEPLEQHSSPSLPPRVLPSPEDQKAMLKQSTASESEMENTIGFVVCVGQGPHGLPERRPDDSEHLENIQADCRPFCLIGSKDQSKCLVEHAKVLVK